jgi:hypothetical protein
MAYATIIWLLLLLLFYPIHIMVADVVIVIVADGIWIFTDNVYD